MAISLKHNYQSAIADSGDPTVVQPSDWNAEHVLTLGTGKLLGRTTAGTGAAEEISVDSSLTFSSGSLGWSNTQPLLIGGTTASSSLTLQSTSGVGTSDSILFKVGNNGATTAMTIDTSGRVGIGTSTPSAGLEVISSRQIFRDSNAVNTNSSSRIFGGAYTGNAATVATMVGLVGGNTLGLGGGTGLGEPATTIVFYTGAVGTLGSGTERMRIGSAGNIGIGAVGSSQNTLQIGRNITGNATSQAVVNNGTIQSDVTTNAMYYNATAITAAAAFTLNNLFYYRASQGTFGASSAVTNQYGFHSESTIIGATNNYSFFASDTAGVTAGKTAYGFYSNVNTATGGGTTYGFYAAGTAINYFNGNVGIGTNNPTVTFQVASSSSVLGRFYGNNANNYLELSDNNGTNSATFGSIAGGNWYIYTTGYGALYTGGTEKVRIDSSGNVGIGTASPSQRLSVAGSISLTGGLDMASSTNPFITKPAATYAFPFNNAGGLNSSNPFWLGYQFASPVVTQGGVNTFPRASHFYSYTTATDPTDLTYNIRLGNAGTLAHNFLLSAGNVSGYMSFLTSNAERMRIDSSGNVGIGVTPSAWGTFKAVDIGNGSIQNYIGTTPGSMGIGNNFYFDGTNYRYKVTGAAGLFSVSADGGFIWYNAASGTAGATFSITERMRIDSSGNVGIGTSSPGAKLDVVGSIFSSAGVGFYKTSANITVNNGLVLGTVSKSVAPSGGQGSIQVFSDDAANRLEGTVELITSATASERRLRIGAVEQGVAFRNVTLAESGGNVGIGTSSPSYKFHVDGGSTAQWFLGRSTGTTVTPPSSYSAAIDGFLCQVVADASPFNRFTDLVAGAGGSASIMRFFTGTSASGSLERMRIDSSGNVGIGTSSPQTILTLNAASATTALSGYASSTFIYGLGRIGNGIAYDSYDYHAFYTNSTTGPRTGTERMRIDSSGNVGIGTASPSAKLDVFGTNTTIRINENTSTYQMVFRGNSAAPNIYDIKEPTANRVAISFDTSNQHTTFLTAGSERMRIDSSGNVGIGTASPSQKLDVSGSIKWSGATYENVFTITDGAAFEIDPANGTIQLITLGASRTPKATNFAAGQAITLMIDDGTAYTITWTDATFGTGGVSWVNNGRVAPTLATTGYTVVCLWKTGSQVYGALVGN